jgi:pheromone shutdown-related protein TraB
MSEYEANPSTDSDDDIVTVRIGSREVLLVGTAHVSRESADLVERTIQREKPDHVCIELDDQRYQALVKKQEWESLDLRQVIRRRQLATLIANLVLATYQRRIGDKLGILPGTELLAAARAAEESGIPFSLCDRQIRVTLLRAWRSMSLFQRAKLMTFVLSGLLVDPDLSEEDLREMRKKDVLSELMEGLSQALPTLKRVLIDERDRFLAERIRATDGRKIVAVVGAGHVEGIRKILEGGEPVDMSEISETPSARGGWKWVGWAIPAVIVGSLGAIAWTKGLAVAGDNLWFWILANGIPAGIGAILALAHPLTILVAFVAAPITSLTPVIGAGYVTAFVQAYVCPPYVRDFQRLSADAGSLTQWWRNRLLRVLLAFILPTIGSIVGTYVGGIEIVRNLF